MGIAEILAAKKAAAAQQASTVEIKEVAKEVVAVTASSLGNQNTANAEAPKQEVPKLSFAEMMAAKRAAAGNASTVTAVSSPSTDAVGGEQNLSQAPAPVATGMLSLAETESQTTTASNRAEDISDPRRDEAVKNAQPEDEQAYVKIREKIDALWGTEDANLEGAMSDLKKTLLANPNACLLMYASDLGEMVKNLRRLTKEAQAEAAKEKTSTKKIKAAKLNLSPEQLEAAFEEL